MPRGVSRVGSPSSLSRYERLEMLVDSLASRSGGACPVRPLIQILADEGVVARDGETNTAHSNVACPSTRGIWYTFCGYPAASHGN